MKIVLNTKYKKSAASMFYHDAMSSIENISFFDYRDYSLYDVALFMTYEEDLIDLKYAKINNPELRTGLIDPRGSHIEEVLKYIDFFVVDSIEMKDFFLKYGLPIYTYYEYPNIEMTKKIHANNTRIIIGYHGNKIHLTAMYPTITAAIELLSDQYEIEFWAMYNIDELGMWNIGVPKGVKVKHIQWSMDNYKKYLSKADIGIVPACMPIKNIDKIKKISRVSRYFLDNNDDYLLKFKMPSNPGRIIVFAKLGIPVVADMLPSNLQAIQDGENGLIAYSSAGWYYALEKLINSASLRQEFSDNMKKYFYDHFDYRKQNIMFVSFLNNLLLNQRESKAELNEKKHHLEHVKFNNAYLYNLYKKFKGM